MECRSTERRQWIVDNYNVVPIAHIQLLAGQTKHSDAGSMIEMIIIFSMQLTKQVEEEKLFNVAWEQQEIS